MALQRHSRNNSDSPTPSDSENLLALSVEVSSGELLKSSDLADLVYQDGCKFFFVDGLWFRLGDDLFDDPPSSVERLENDESACHRWLRLKFMNGLDTQRRNTATWIRSNCSSILGVSAGDLLSTDARSTKFRQAIGWVSETGVYSSVDVPILHKDWLGEYSLSSAFLSPKLMGIYVALIYGLSAGEVFINGGSVQPRTKTIAQFYKIRNITPGAIATCGILARWALSADDTLQEVGSSTGIHYFDDFQEYLTIFETGLQRRTAGIINIIKQWDEKIFPASD